MIASKEQLEQAALDMGLLPFFTNAIEGFSVQEMAAPGMLFADDADGYGCWEWKGPVIREQTTAYGKFFRRKAGFVSRELLPDFIHYRRRAYPVPPGSAEEYILQLVRSRQGLTSTELKRLVPAPPTAGKGRRTSLEGPLQYLQMGGWLLIADFEYKYTRLGRRYGWGVALYSTPEVWFEQEFPPIPDRTPAQSLERLVNHLAPRLPQATEAQIRKLLS